MGSPIDRIFAEIFGYSPPKDGVAYEKLAAIATYLLLGGEVKHDDSLRGAFSKTLYQLDVRHSDGSDSTMGEAKDYSDRDGKVGRGDLQKLGGALPDLPGINRGAFFSATGYTRPAQKYASAAQELFGKPITLYGLRPSAETDDEGRIRTIILTMHIVAPDLNGARWQPHLAAGAHQKLKTLLAEGESERQLNIRLEHFYDQSGAEVRTLHDVTQDGYGEVHEETQEAHGCFWLKGCYVNVEGVLAEIRGLEYALPYTRDMREVRITDDSKQRFVLTDAQGTVLRFITDEELKQYEFDEAGNLRKI